MNPLSTSVAIPFRKGSVNCRLTIAAIYKAEMLLVADEWVPAGLPATKRPQCVAYLAAHWLTLRDNEGVAGSITSRKEGQLQVNYSGATGQGLETTSYGQQYKTMVRALTGGGVMFT